jgi:hypothetical protein
MDHFAGMDVSVKETSLCILDDAGKIVKEVKVASEPQALLKVLGNPTYRFKRIGLEAGSLSQWLFSALAEAKLPVICVETRHMQAVLHPRYGQTVTVTSRIRRGNDVAVTIRQPDGTLAQLPIWMTEDSAEVMAVTEIPRLPLAHLRELIDDHRADQAAKFDQRVPVASVARYAVSARFESEGFPNG